MYLLLDTRHSPIHVLISQSNIHKYISTRLPVYPSTYIPACLSVCMQACLIICHLFFYVYASVYVSPVSQTDIIPYHKSKITLMTSMFSQRWFHYFIQLFFPETSHVVANGIEGLCAEWRQGYDALRLIIIKCISEINIFYTITQNWLLCTQFFFGVLK